MGAIFSPGGASPPPPPAPPPLPPAAIPPTMAETAVALAGAQQRGRAAQASGKGGYGGTLESSGGDSAPFTGKASLLGQTSSS